MFRPSRLLWIGVGLAATVAGCRNQMTEDDGDGDVTAVELTTAQKAAIDDVVFQIEATVMALAGTLEGIDTIELDSLQSESDCPALDLHRDPQTGTTVTVDFAEGCTNDLFDESAVSGSVTMMLSLAAASLNVAFADFTVDDQTSNGSLATTYSRTGTERTLTGELNLTTTGAGSVSGTLTLVVDGAGGTITVSEASLGLEPEDDDPHSITIDGLVIAPLANHSFIPQAGTVSFNVPNEGAGPPTLTITLAFDAESPLDRTIGVTVGSAAPVEYTLPGGPT